jgi:hypothetical protein
MHTDFLSVTFCAQAAPTDRFVWGSVTKVITGTALLRLQEKGLLDLDAPVKDLVDPLLLKMKANSSIEMNFTKLSDLWGAESDKITIRMLATMESGLPDFDTARPTAGKPTDSFRATVLQNPSEDFGPLKLISFPWVAIGSLKFPPGSKFDYSSTNFVLLGLALCAATPGCDSWDQYDQATVFTDEVKSRMEQGVDFGAHGDPSDYSQVHGYDRTPLSLLISPHPHPLPPPTRRCTATTGRHTTATTPRTDLAPTFGKCTVLSLAGLPVMCACRWEMPPRWRTLYTRRAVGYSTTHLST